MELSQLTFIVEDKHREYAMQKVGKLWRSFKTGLTGKLYTILKKDGSPENIKLLGDKVKADYGVPEDLWTRFVQSRMTPEFEAIRKKNQRNQSQQTAYHHSARRPYSDIREDLVSYY